jgi:protein-S-isoprenylcysteine O-methyltransferase Ste14
MSEQVERQAEENEARLDRLAHLRPVFLTLIAIVLSGVLLLAGGRWDWVEGWALAGVYSVLLIGSGLWTARHAPGLGRERTQAIARPGSLHERAMLILAPSLLVAMIVVAALDGGRFRWSEVPLGVEIAGFGLFAAYIALNVWAALSNPFLSAVARVQEDRDHHVIVTGPYRLVRHPMYLGLCLLGLGVPLALGSWWGLIPGGMFTLTFIYRTWQEDRFLRGNLPGYVEYTRQTRCRLIPGVW